MTDPLIEAWRKLTAALLTGAMAADDVDAALGSMRSTIDSFPVAEVTRVGASVEELASTAGGYAQEAAAILSAAVEVMP